MNILYNKKENRLYCQKYLYIEAAVTENINNKSADCRFHTMPMFYTNAKKTVKQKKKDLSSI